MWTGRQLLPLQARRWQGFLLLLLAAFSLASCGSGNPESPRDAASPDLSGGQSAQQDGLPATVEQLSASVGATDGSNNDDDVVLLTVANKSEATVLVLAVTLYSPRFSGGTDWVPDRAGGTRLSPGDSLSVPASLQPVRCQEDPDHSEATIAITVDRAETGSLTVEVAAADPQGVLEARYQYHCSSKA
ncbi:hypothetical protein [Arthrobacter sp. VKM Ac-2550]|uniref:hypothetical protein n=1 Tax=Crystallibacter permensis TaxID=1938888 RepID=UPI002226389D|nr:hypothetical protein [Arthrobacter sp. VKM Ac-2550]